MSLMSFKINILSRNLLLRSISLNVFLVYPSHWKKKQLPRHAVPLGVQRGQKSSSFSCQTERWPHHQTSRKKLRQGTRTFLFEGRVCGICLSSEWPVRERKQICILGRHARAGAKQHACFITQRKEEATIRTRRIVKKWNVLDLTGKRWRPSTGDVSLAGRRLKLH